MQNDATSDMIANVQATLMNMLWFIENSVEFFRPMIDKYPGAIAAMSGMFFILLVIALWRDDSLTQSEIRDETLQMALAVDNSRIVQSVAVWVGEVCAWVMPMLNLAMRLYFGMVTLGVLWLAANRMYGIHVSF